MAPKGKTPSLIGSGAGSSKFVTAAGTRHCSRCDTKIVKSVCAEVTIPGTMGHRTYCGPCYTNILAKTQDDLTQLELQAQAAFK